MNSSDWRTPGVVLACGSIILMLSLGIRQSFGLFLQPMSGELGWGRETFAFALALQNPMVWMVAVGLSVLAAVLCLPIDERELAALPVRRPAV
jgi:hypothetical protein